MANRARDAERKSYWRSVQATHAASGLSVAAFCQLEKLSQPSFYDWRRTSPSATISVNLSDVADPSAPVRYPDDLSDQSDRPEFSNETRRRKSMCTREVTLLSHSTNCRRTIEFFDWPATALLQTQSTG
jgi:hypothetical protein